VGTVRRTALDDLADRIARVTWCWPALLTVVAFEHRHLVGQGNGLGQVRP